MFSAAVRRFATSAIRRFATSAIRRSHYDEGPGQTFPFSVENKWRLLALFTLFTGGGTTMTVLAARNFAIRHEP